VSEVAVGYPRSDDPVIDAALARLADVADSDIDGVLTHADEVLTTLRSRLADLGG
jgi:hypothetical protein